MSSQVSPNYTQTTFGQIAKKLVNGGTPPTEIAQFWNGKIPWITGADFTTNGIGEFRRFVSETAVAQTATNLIDQGQLLLVTRTGVGKLAIAPCDIAISQDITGIYPDTEKVDVRFLYHRMRLGVEELKKLNQGTSINGIIRSDLLAYPIELPTLPQQRRIAEILSTMDDAIDQTEALIAKHQQIKAGLMHDLFTRGVTPDGHLRPTREQAPDLYKESPLGWIPKEWEVAEIQTVSSLCVDCPHTTPILSDEGYPMARTSEIRDGGLHIDLSPRVSRDQYLSRVSRGVPQEGDIVFTREAPVGEAFVIPPDVELCLGQRVMLIRLNRTRCQPEFFLFQLYSARVQREFDRIVGGTTNPHLNVEDVRKFKICIPNLREQERTASRLLSVSDRMFSESKKLTKLRQQKHGLMHDLLTGRVRVPITEQ